MELTPPEATPRAMALLTIAHEIYSDSGAADDFDDLVLKAVLRDDVDGEVDWRSIAIALAMIGHVMVDTIPDILYSAAEEACAETVANWLKVPVEEVDVKIRKRISGTLLLQQLSLHIAMMRADPES